MKDYGLDFSGQMIMEEYEEQRPMFEKLKDVVLDIIRRTLKEGGVYVTGVEGRVKAEASLAEKLERKGYKYHSLQDLTDILGVRVITIYSDDVDKVSALMEKVFEVDWNESVDKRKSLQLNQFGYMSLHYICRLPQSVYRDKDYPGMNEYRFEIQMRTALQHVWSCMHHDTGYKSEIEIPTEYLRNMNRIAGMLELADEQFSRIRKEITDYRRNVQRLVADGNFDEVPLDGDTFRSYLELNPFKSLIDKIATINQAEVYKDSMMRYLDVLLALDFKTLGDVERLRKTYEEPAYQLSLHQLSGSDLDIMAQSVGLQNLCTVYILKKGLGAYGLERLYNAIGGVSESNKERAQRTLVQAQKINLI